MKRDWKLLGEIFTHIEKEDFKEFINESLATEKQRILRHAELLIDGGYIVGMTIRRAEEDLLFGFEPGGARITLKGYDFADIVQDKKLLNKTIKVIEDAGYMVSMETLKSFAPKILAMVTTAIL